jgi:hypothetical protein
MSAINVPYDKLVTGRQYSYGNMGPVTFKGFSLNEFDSNGTIHFSPVAEFELDGVLYFSKILLGRDSPFYILPIAASAAGRTRRRRRRTIRRYRR